MGYYIALGNRIRAIRKGTGLSRQDVANALGISYSAYANYENGYRKMDIQTAHRICEILKCNLYDILED